MLCVASPASAATTPELRITLNYEWVYISNFQFQNSFFQKILKTLLTMSKFSKQVLIQDLESVLPQVYYRPQMFY